MNGLACYSRQPAILSGTVTLNDGLLGSPSVLTNSGTVSGPGTIVGTFENRGTLESGRSGDVTSIQGEFVQTGEGTLRLTLGGTDSNRYDRLAVSGHAALDGTLEILLHPSYCPRGGDAFDLLDWGARSGGFDIVSLPPLPPGLRWDASRLDLSGLLRVHASGMVILIR